MSESRGKSCLKYGCLGCLGLVLLVLLVGGALLAAAWFAGDEPAQVEEQRLEQALPPTALPPTREPVAGDPLRDIVQGFPLAGHDVAEPGRIELDLAMGEFEIVPGPADEPAHVDAVYDTKRYVLKQSWDTWGENGWTYRVSFSRRGLLSLLGTEGPAPRLRVVIPRDHPFVLDGRIRMGESRMELGGLWVLEARLEYSMGEHSVTFSEPLAAPMRSFEAKGSMGEVRFDGMGHASPASVDVRHSMGALSLDLDGQWVNDAEVRARCTMGECAVSVPDGVTLDLEQATILLGEHNVRGVRDRPPAPPGAPTIRLRVSHSMGEMRVEG